MRNSKRAKIEKNIQFKNRDNNIDFMKFTSLLQLKHYISNER